MSYRHPLRQTQTADYSTNKRQPSNASTVSTVYSNSSGAFELSRTSTLSSTNSSAYGGHKRGLSEAAGMSHSANENGGARRSPQPSPESPYKSVRQSLRPLPQPPGPSPPSYERNGSHTRGHSMDIAKTAYDGQYTPTATPRASPIRPNSMVLSRSDSINRGHSTLRNHPMQHQHSPLTAADLPQLQRSSTSQLRTLSKFAESASPDEFNITTPGQEVIGLHGRRRLQRSGTVKPGKNIGSPNKGSGYSWEGRNWMDKQRQFLQAYEYLCHIGEAKEWIEDVLQRPIPPIVQLEEALRDGVTLAEIVDALYPERRIRIFRHPKLQYRHSDNMKRWPRCGRGDPRC